MNVRTLARNATLAIAVCMNASADTHTWDGEAEDNLYGTALNWDINEVPAQADTAVIGAGYTVDVTTGTAGDGLGVFSIGGTVNFRSIVETKQCTLGKDAAVTVDFPNGGRWDTRHAANWIAFQADTVAGDYCTVRLVLKSGTAPLTSLKHEKLTNISNCNLVVDVTNLSIVPTEAAPLYLFECTGGNKDIVGQQTFNSVTFVGGGNYALVYDYTAEKIAMVYAPPAGTLILMR